MSSLPSECYTGKQVVSTGCRTTPPCAFPAQPRAACHVLSDIPPLPDARTSDIVGAPPLPSSPSDKTCMRALQKGGGEGEVEDGGGGGVGGGSSGDGVDLVVVLLRGSEGR